METTREEYSVTAAFDQTHSWDYAVEDEGLLVAVMQDHAERHSAEQDIRPLSDGFVHREGDRAHLYHIDDGVETQLSVRTDITGATSAFDEHGFQDREEGRHRSMVPDRMNALVGRANKAAELVEYIQGFEEYGLAETVLDSYREGPVLDGEWLRADIIRQEGIAALEDVPEHLFERPGVVEVDDAAYDDVVEQVCGDALYDERGAGALDLEAASRERSMADYFRDDDDYEQVYDAVIGLVEDRLGGEA